MVTREGYDRLCEAMVDQGGSLEMRVLCCHGWLGRGRYVYSQRDFGSFGVLTIMSGECLGSAGSAGICWVVSGYVVMGSGIGIRGNVLMGHDGVYRRGVVNRRECGGDERDIGSASVCDYGNGH